jgi:hypothetical protein
MSLMGRCCKFNPKRSSQRRGAYGLAQGLRPLYLVQLTFMPPVVATPIDRLLPVSVSSPPGGQRPQPAALQTLTAPTPRSAMR